MSNTLSSSSRAKLFGMVIGAVGIVYGDIGTSPIYTLQVCFGPDYGMPLIESNIFGVLSLIFWSLLVVVSLKYVLFIMRADNNGEGGVLALMALASRLSKRQRGEFSFFIILGICGAALFYGDSIITPAVEILSAVEGIRIVAPHLDAYILPITIAIIIALFALQRHGTAVVGRVFGPVMVLWFLILAAMGIANIVNAPHILGALSPLYAVRFFFDHPWGSFLMLGAVVLALTGAEAVYADMGHFGRKPIQIGWFCLAWPALILNYFGQGALLLTNKAAVASPFFLMAPTWFLLPLVAISTLATVIASQAVISGAFSLTRQAIQLGYFPRMSIRHTSEHEIGQIYIPTVNWGLLVAVIVLVLGFKTSTNLAAAYGLAVTGTMAITTILAFVAMSSLTGWKKSGMRVLLSIFLIADVTLLASNMMKIFEGGWVPILVATIVLFVMTTWKQGRRQLYLHLHDDTLEIVRFVQSMQKNMPVLVEGTAVYMTGNVNTVPQALLHNLKHNKVIHEKVIFLTINTNTVPYVSAKQRVDIFRLSENFWQIVATYGFNEKGSVPELLTLISEENELHLDPMNISFFLSRETIVRSRRSELSGLQRMCFILMQRLSARPTDFFEIPPNRVVEMGVQVEI